MSGEHQAARPSWDCAACARPWPCDPAQERLATDTGGGTRLAVLMWTYLETYCSDRHDGPLGEVFERFIAWTRRSRAPRMPIGGPTPTRSGERAQA
ncbi:hypothetical protein EV385_0356 [Krasilnikovia cinnamomea]|uniref:Flavin reductase n=1 Tax=Krasilnikovia cinnamomea TaxID=349313 RepID=A0A4Q7ZDC0_9ACTN|nr:hypothetical protein EV385_0356 [Krasilnikovia cinnamomea]